MRLGAIFRFLVVVLFLALPAVSWAREVRVVCHPSRGPAVTVMAEVADTPELRARGLMFRRELKEGRGMWFVFEGDVHHAFWMKNTFVPLDIIFVGADHRIVDIIPNAKPLSETPLSPRAPYRFVLEAPAGFAARNTLMRGTTVEAKTNGR